MNKKIDITKYVKVHYLVLKDLIKNYKKQSIILLFISVLSVFSNVVGLMMIQYISNIIVSNYEEHLSSLAPVFLTLTTIFIFLFIIQILQNIFNIVNQKYSDKISADIEKKLVYQLSEIPYELYESQIFHEKINLSKQAFSQYGNAIFAISQFLQIVITLISYSILLAKINWIYIIISILSIIISSLISARTTDKQLDFWRKNVSPKQRTKEYFQSIYSDKINHAVNQVNRNVSFFIKKHSESIKNEKKQYLKLNTISFVSELLSSVLFLITFLITILICGNLVTQGVVEIGFFNMTIALLINLYNTIKTFSMFVLDSNWYVRVIDCYNEVMNIEKSSKLKSSLSNNVLSINNIRYKYAQSKNFAIAGISEKFKFGEKIAIVGYNGSGKTTLVSILLNLFPGYEGNIDINKNVIVTSINQDFGKYQISIRENIELGNGGIPLEDKEIFDIVNKVGLNDFIKSLPYGIDTIIGEIENGIDLSKGQWQRLAIGRLLANKQANVWILDEPTAYLDPLLEIDIYKLIFNLSEDRLVFFISHRLGFARFADRILVLQDGIIVENGTHNELIGYDNSIYKEMFNAQKEFYENIIEI